jgi:hypothetical protein
MKIIKSESSFINIIDYVESDETLRLMFKDGKIYECTGIEPKVIEEFINAESHGNFFVNELKPNYKFILTDFKWISCGVATEDIKVGDMLETCPVTGRVRKFVLPDLK